MKRLKAYIDLWGKRWIVQVLICLLLGLLHIFIGAESKSAADDLVGIYGVSPERFDDIGATLWLLPIMSACIFSNMYLELELGQRMFYVLPRYGSWKNYKKVLYKDMVVGWLGFWNINIGILLLTGMIALVKNEQLSNLDVSDCVLSVFLYGLHLLFLISVMLNLQLKTQNARMSQTIILMCLVSVFFIPLLPKGMVYLDIGAWGSIMYSSKMWEDGFFWCFIIAIELFYLLRIVFGKHHSIKCNR